MKLPFLSGHTPPKPSWYPPLLVIWEPLPQHLWEAAAVPRTAQGTDTQPGQKGGQGTGGEVAAGLRAELSEMEEGKANPARSAPILFPWPSDPGIRNSSGGLVNSNRTQSPSFPLLSARPRRHGKLMCVLSALWYLAYGSQHFLFNLLKHNNGLCCPAARVGDKEHRNMSFPIKARKGVVTGEVLKWHLHLGDKQAHSVPGKDQDVVQ